MLTLTDPKFRPLLEGAPRCRGHPGYLPAGPDLRLGKVANGSALFTKSRTRWAVAVVVGRGGEHGRAGGDRGVRDDDDADADGGGAILLRGGFVQDQQWGGGDQAAGHRDTLAFAAGQGAAAVVVLDGDPDAGQLEQPRPPCGVIEQCGRPGRRARQRCRIAGLGDPAGPARTRRRRSARRRPRVLARRPVSA